MCHSPLNHEMQHLSSDFERRHREYWMMSPAHQQIKITDSRRNLKADICNVEVSTMPADGLVTLTQLALDKLTADLADDILKYIFINEKFRMPLKFIPRCPIDNNQALVKIIVSCWLGDKPLSEPMLAWFTDAYMRDELLEHLKARLWPCSHPVSWTCKIIEDSNIQASNYSCFYSSI